MKKKLLLIFAPLLLSTSFASYAADEAGQAQQEMNRFQSAIKQFQKKIKFHQRCMQGKCSPQEKAHANAELKKAAKIAIPTAIGVIVVIGGAVIYKKSELIFKKLLKLSDYIEKKTSKKNHPYETMIETAIYTNNLNSFKKEIQKINTNELSSVIEKLLVEIMLDEKSNHIQMLTALFEKYPEKAVNLKWSQNNDNFPLLSYALKYKIPKLIFLILKQPKIKVHTKQVSIENLPLSHALELDDDDITQEILNQYTQDQLDDFMFLFPRKPQATNVLELPEAKRKRKIYRYKIKKLQELAQNPGLTVKEKE